MKSLLSWIGAAAVALVLVGATDGGGAEAASDPYWATCASLADGDVRRDTAAALVERAGLAALSTPQMAIQIDEACAGRSPHYRPGLDALRSALGGRVG